MFHQAKLTDFLIKEALLPLTFFQFSNSLCNIHLYIGSYIATTAAKLKMTPCKKDRWFNFTVKFISLTLSYPHTSTKKCVSKRSVKHQVTLCSQLSFQHSGFLDADDRTWKLSIFNTSPRSLFRLLVEWWFWMCLFFPLRRCKSLHPVPAMSITKIYRFPLTPNLDVVHIDFTRAWWFPNLAVINTFHVCISSAAVALVLPHPDTPTNTNLNFSTTFLCV